MLKSVGPCTSIYQFQKKNKNMVLKLQSNQVHIPINGQAEKKAILTLLKPSFARVQIKLLFEDSSVWYSQLLQDDNQLELLLNEPLSIVFINNEVSLLNERFGTVLNEYKFSEVTEEQEPNAPLCLEDRFTQLEKKFNQLQENYVNLLQYCGDLQIQVSFLNKYRNLAIGCKVEHVKKGHTVITHGLTSVTGLGSQP